MNKEAGEAAPGSGGTEAGRRGLREPLFWGAVAACVGVMAAHVGGPVWVGAIWLVPVGLGLAGIPRCRALGVLMAVLAVFAWRYSAIQEGREAVMRELGGEAGWFAIDVALEGVVVDVLAEAETWDRARYLIEVSRIEPEGAGVLRGRRVAVWAPASYRCGDRVLLRGRVESFPAPRNPGEREDSEVAWRENRLVAKLDLVDRRDMEKQGVSWVWKARDVSYRARDWIGDAVTRGLEKREVEAGVLKAMILGAKDEADPAAEEAFRYSGALHIFAVSGLHVGIFGSVIWILLRLAGVRRREAVVVMALAVTAYAFVTGLSPSAVRAALMMVVFLGGFLVRRRPRLLNSLGFAALMILAIRPEELLAPGFQLSFGVVIGLGMFCGRLARWWAQPLEPDAFLPEDLVPPWRRRLAAGGRVVAGLFAVSFVAWAASAPLIAWHFGLVTPVGMLSNVVLMPLAWLVIAAAAVSLALSGVGLGAVAAWVNLGNAGLVSLLQGLAVFFAGLPGSHLHLATRGPGVPGTGPEQGQIVVFDSRDSVLPVGISMPKPSWGLSGGWLIDCGRDDVFRGAIRPWFASRGVARLDGLVATHGDASHLRAGPWVLRDLDPGVVVSSHLPERSPVLSFLREEGEANRVVGTGDRLEVGPGVEIEVLYPPSGMEPLRAGDDECLVVRIHWEGWRILCLSDSGFPTETWLLEQGEGGMDLGADVVVRSRHGSDVSDARRFLAAVEPSIVMASNAFFPGGERVLDRERAAAREVGAVFLDPVRTGGVTLEVEGGELVVTPFLGGEAIRLKRP